MPIFFTLLLLIPSIGKASIFGEENIALFKLVMGQIVELEKLTEAIGIAKDQRAFLLEINKGIENVSSQIENIEAIIKRAEHLDPSAVKRMSDITSFLNETKNLKRDIDILLQSKLLLTEEAIISGGLQSETAYLMGQEMISAGANLAIESKTASPGRATQISAAASSSQMLASGVLLQTLSQLTQLQTMSLELKRSEIEKNLLLEKARKQSILELLKAEKRHR